MKKVKCKKEYGTWYYTKLEDFDLDGPIYVLFDEEHERVTNFGCYSDMKYYIETGIILG